VFALGIAIVVIALVLALVVVIALDPGPAPSDVAVAYEQAWDRLDFETLWALSGNELRDSRTRTDFVKAKRAAYEDQRALAALAREVEIEEELVGSELAVVRTRLELHDGTTVCNQIELALRDGTWKVTGYKLHPEGAPAQPESS
jgi:hypothetical protein